jgi:hypothetical protein
MESLGHLVPLARFYLKARPWRTGRTHRTRLRKNARASTIVLSFPKSGRTWHNLMLGHYLATAGGVPERDALNLSLLCERLGLPLISYSHGGAYPIDAVPSRHPTVADPEMLRGKRVLLLIRDPRDILVSAYFHARDRKGLWFLGLSDFVRNDRTGITKILAAYSRWFAARDLAAAYAVTAYEDMHADPAAALRQALELAGVPIDEARIRDSVAFASFDNMRRMEEADFFGDKIMRSTGPSPDGRKVRSGRVGGHREHLSDSDLAIIAGAIEKAGGPIAERYAHPARTAPVAAK